MVMYHQGLGRKKTGGRQREWRGKKKKHFGRPPARTTIGKKEVRKVRTKGNNEKQRAQKLDEINLYDPEEEEWNKVEVQEVLKNNANRHFARMGIITKGAIIQTEMGKAKVENRPGQEGFVNATLIKE